jgi:hypothetical protein
MKTDQSSTTQQKANIHDTTSSLLDAMYAEFKELAKKKPDAAVSKNKITIVNRLLEKVREMLESESSIAFLDLLNEDDIPQVSDVTLILSQYAAAMDDFKSKYYGFNGMAHTWFID